MTYDRTTNNLQESSSPEGWANFDFCLYFQALLEEKLFATFNQVSQFIGIHKNPFFYLRVKELLPLF